MLHKSSLFTERDFAFRFRAALIDSAAFSYQSFDFRVSSSLAVLLTAPLVSLGEASRFTRGRSSSPLRTATSQHSISCAPARERFLPCIGRTSRARQLASLFDTHQKYNTKPKYGHWFRCLSLIHISEPTRLGMI